MGHPHHVTGNIRNACASVKVLLQANPLDDQVEQVKAQVLNLKHVLDIHALKLWTLDGEHHVLSAHLVVAAMDEPEATASLKQRIRDTLHTFSITEVTLELEQETEACKLRACFINPILFTDTKKPLTDGSGFFVKIGET